MLLLFLSLNAESFQLLSARIVAAGFFVGVLFFISGLKGYTASFIKFPVSLLIPFLLTEIARFCYGISLPSFLAGHYMSGAGMWVFFFLLIAAARVYYSQKDRVNILFQAFIAGSIFMAMNSIPRLLMTGNALYKEGGSATFLHPLFYRMEPVSSFIFGKWSSENWAGDFIAFGVFAALSLGFYDLYRIFEKKERINRLLPLMWFLLSLINVIALLLFKSRGTVIFFAAAFLFYLVVVLIKMPFRGKGAAGALLFFVFLVAAYWGANLPQVIREVQTLQDEVTPESRRSFRLNVEASRRAHEMFRKYPVFGVGRGNYKNLSEEFAASGEVKFGNAGASGSCQSHYLQTLTEEGLAGVAYFLFLAGAVVWSFRKIWMTRSCFQLLAGLALLMPVLLVLGHGLINDILDRFSMAALVYLSLGSLGGLLSSDFQHESK